MTDKSDVAGRLRATFDKWNNPPSDGLPEGAGVMLEAADEIDRLTAALASERERAEKAERLAELHQARNADGLLGRYDKVAAERDALARKVTELEGALASGMSALINDVRAFHEACGVPVGETPAIVAERVQLRRSILAEEWRETDEAMQRGDLVEVADGLADVIYVAIGTALEFGIPLDRVWAEVQRSNMAKRDPSTGKVRRRDDGKILKPDGWTPPDIARALIPAKED